MLQQKQAKLAQTADGGCEDGDEQVSHGDGGGGCDDGDEQFPHDDGGGRRDDAR